MPNSLFQAYERPVGQSNSHESPPGHLPQVCGSRVTFIGPTESSTLALPLISLVSCNSQWSSWPYAIAIAQVYYPGLVDVVMGSELGLDLELGNAPRDTVFTPFLGFFDCSSGMPGRFGLILGGSLGPARGHKHPL